MTMSQSRLSQLIGDIYDAALDSELWPNALEEVCSFVGGSEANIFWQDVIGKAAKKFYGWGNDPHYTRLYLETYAKINPLFPAVYAFPVGQVYQQSDVISFAELHETRIYKEWMQPQGFVDFIGCHLDKSAGSCIPLTIIRHERDGLVDERAISRMDLIVPHIRRAALIGNVVGLRTCEAATLADTLDGLAAGILLVDGTGRITHANASGRAMLDAGAILFSHNLRLAARDEEADEALKEVFAAANSGDAAVGIRAVAVSMIAPSGQRYVAHVLPLTSGARRHAGTTYDAVAAVFVHEATMEVPSAPNALAKAYKLTAMELRVLLGIVQVGGGPSVAEELGISETTVRSHLRHVFQKTGTSRQADLVKLVAAFESPWRDR
jgi:DNA-binding CsgD family transcriptional regulator/PAS domain-containing protein